MPVKKKFTQPLVVMVQTLRMSAVKPQNLSYVNSWLVLGVGGSVCLSMGLVSVCVFECAGMYLSDCVLVCLCFCKILDAVKNMTKKTQLLISTPST